MKKQITRRDFLKDCATSSIGLVGLTAISSQGTTKDKIRNLFKKIPTRGIFYGECCPPEEGIKGFSVNKNNLDDFSEEQLKKTLTDLKSVYRGKQEIKALIRDYAA